MTEQIIEQGNTSVKKTILFWKASIILLVWVFLLGSAGMTIGKRYFWSGINVRQIEREAEYYRQLVDMEPEDPEHRVSLAFNLNRLGDQRGALAQLQTAIDTDKDYFDAYLNRGYVYSDMGYWDEALADFEKCVELSPEDYKGHFNLGIVYRELDMIEVAYETLEKALELRPGGTDILYHLALTAEKDSNLDLAISYLERTLAFDPNYREALDLYRKLTR